MLVQRIKRIIGGRDLQKSMNEIKKAFLVSLPVFAGYIVLGIGFGILLQTKGFGVGWAFAMSLLIYAGSMQYLAVDLLAGGAALITAAVTTLMVNARHIFYGISMVDKYRDVGKKKPYLIFALTDETYSLVCSEDAGEEFQDKKRYYFWVSLFNHSYWVIGSVIGSLLGMVFPFSTEGMDFVLTALFVTIFVEQWMSTKNHIYALVGVAASVACLLVFGADHFLIPAMIVITLGLAGVRKLELKQEGEK